MDLDIQTTCPPPAPEGLVYIDDIVEIAPWHDEVTFSNGEVATVEHGRFSELARAAFAGRFPVEYMTGPEGVLVRLHVQPRLTTVDEARQALSRPAVSLPVPEGV